MVSTGVPKRRPAGVLVGLAYIAFISLGLPDGLLGVGWPSIRDFFNLPLDALGALLVTATAGYLIASFSSGFVLARMSVGTLLAVSCLLTAISLLVYAFTPLWVLMVMFGLVAGLGAGAIDAGLNTYVATQYSARVLNWLHACFGIGATIGPLIMTAVLANGLPWQRGYLIVGGAQLGLALCFGLTRSWWRPSAETTEEHVEPVRPARGIHTLRLPVMWMSIALFLLYTGIEISAGQWAYSLFTQARGVSTTTAGLWISIYWGSLTIGRVLFGIIVGMAPIRVLLRTAMISIVMGAGLLWLNLTPLLSFLGLALMGFALAPIFPSLIATTPERLGQAHTANGVGFQVAAAGLGGAAIPSLFGLLADTTGLELLGPFLFVGAVLHLVLYEGVLRASPPA